MSIYNESIFSCWKDGDSTWSNEMLFCVSIKIDHNVEETSEIILWKNETDLNGKDMGVPKQVKWNYLPM